MSKALDISRPLDLSLDLSKVLAINTNAPVDIAPLNIQKVLEINKQCEAPSQTALISGLANMMDESEDVAVAASSSSVDATDNATKDAPAPVQEVTPNRILLISHGGFIGEMLSGAG